MKEIKVYTNRYIQHSQIGKLSTVRISERCNLTYIFNVIPMKIPVGSFYGCCQSDYNVYMKDKRPKILKEPIQYWKSRTKSKD